MPLFFDPMFLILVALPSLLIAGWASLKVKTAFAKMSKIPARSGMTGAEAAARILHAYGVNNVGIERAQGHLGDHYDPRHKVLRLSKEVYDGRSLSAVGVAAHEAGHALQDKDGYAPLKLRNGIVPLASFGSSTAYLLVIGGVLLNIGPLLTLGVIAFSLVVAFQLINLPVEFNASSRARRLLVEQGIIAPEEDRGVNKVLSAAAMTYVAATLTAVLTLLYYIMLAGRR